MSLLDVFLNTSGDTAANPANFTCMCVLEGGGLSQKDSRSLWRDESAGIAANASLALRAYFDRYILLNLNLNSHVT